MYLPVIAILGGMLFMRPSGFKESKRDVIRLSPVIKDIESQQGLITCEPMRPSSGGPSIQAPLHCSLLVKAAQVGPSAVIAPASYHWTLDLIDLLETLLTNLERQH